MLRVVIEHAPTEEQKTYYCESLMWTSYDGHPYLLIYKLTEYIELDLLQYRPINIRQVQDTQEEQELKLFDFLFEKKFDNIR